RAGLEPTGGATREGQRPVLANGGAILRSGSSRLQVSSSRVRIPSGSAVRSAELSIEKNQGNRRVPRGEVPEHAACFVRSTRSKKPRPVHAGTSHRSRRQAPDRNARSHRWFCRTGSLLIES